MSKSIALLVVICSISLASAGIFNFLGFRNEMDIYIRESNNTRCLWYNSGIFGLIPRRVNSTTFCRCRDIQKYECTTFNSRAAPTPTTLNNSTTTAGPTISGVPGSVTNSTNSTSST